MHTKYRAVLTYYSSSFSIVHGCWTLKLIDIWAVPEKSDNNGVAYWSVLRLSTGLDEGDGTVQHRISIFTETHNSRYYSSSYRSVAKSTENSKRLGYFYVGWSVLMYRLPYLTRQKAMRHAPFPFFVSPYHALPIPATMSYIQFITIIIAAFVQFFSAPFPVAHAACPAVDACLSAPKLCSTLPVPERSVIQPFPNNAPVEVRKLRRNVFLLRDLAYNALLLRRNRAIALLDAPDSGGGFNKDDGSRTRITDAIEQVLGGVKPTRFDLVYSHGHYDHIGAAKRVVQYMSAKYPKCRIRVYGTQGAARTIRKSVTKRAVIPTNNISPDGLTLYYGKGLRVGIHVLGGHSGGDLALHIPRVGSQPAILFHVDVVFPRWAPFSSLAIATDVGKFVEVHDELLKFDFNIFVGGHMNIGNRADVAHGLRFSKDLLRASLKAPSLVTQEDRAGVGMGNYFTPGKTEFGNLWFLFLTAGRHLEVEKCSRIMIEKWGCRLGGLVEVVNSACFTMLTYVVTDY